MQLIIKILVDIIDFYNQKENAHKTKLEFCTLAPNDMHIIRISYYESNFSILNLSKINLNIYFRELDGVISHNSKDNCISKKNIFEEYEIFDKEEMKKFDVLGFDICLNQKEATKQEIYNWF